VCILLADYCIGFAISSVIWTPSAITKRKDLLEEKPPTLITFKYNEKGWMTNKHMIKRLEEVLDRSLSAPLKNLKKGKAGFDTFKGNLQVGLKTLNLLTGRDVYVRSLIVLFQMGMT
jgi:hypothetical protein